mgnify:FL=1
MNPLNHVAIIMDGNGRWGLKNKKSRNLGHKQGLFTVEKIIKKSIEKKIKYLTLFAFSTENWKRPSLEIKYLFKLLENFLDKRLSNLNKQNIKLIIMGRKNFSSKLNKSLKNAEKLTSNNKKLQINLALNYGSKNEIIDGIKSLIKNKKNITIKNISESLYTKDIPDPDILIRTGETNRLSNFLLWQLAYSEIFFEKKLWPDFNERDYDKIIKKYMTIKRNFGNV